MIEKYSPINFLSHGHEIVYAFSFTENEICLKIEGVCITVTKKNCDMVKIIYSEKATIFCEIFTLLLSCVVPVKSKMKISQNFVAFSEYMNFNLMVGVK